LLERGLDFRLIFPKPLNPSGKARFLRATFPPIFVSSMLASSILPSLHQHQRAPRAIAPADLETRIQQAVRTAYQAPLRTLILQLVAEYGVLTGDQLHRLCQRELPVTERFESFERTLARLCQLDWLTVAPRLAHELHGQGLTLPVLLNARKRDMRLRGYVLGTLGQAVVPDLWPLLDRNPRGILPSDSLVHDALCAEVVVRLAASHPHAWPIPPAQAALWDESKQAFFYRPDGLVLRYAGRTPVGGWLVEFCNETWTAPERAQHKIDVYLELHNSKRWAEWGLNWVPELLVVYRARSTARTFAELTTQLAGKANAVLGLSLDEALSTSKLMPRPIAECGEEE
jgi:hypothetical protein